VKGGSTCVLTMVLVLGAAGAPASGRGGCDSGTVRFVKGAASDFDGYTRDPTPARQEWMRAHYSRMRVYTPYFDSRLAWFPNGWVYMDLYAIYADSPLAAAHPEWILRDAQGTRLFIPYHCGNGTCPQYAADIGNAAFRDYWIGAARTTLAKGYVGLFVDDVNMDLSRVSNGTGAPTVPQDPRTARAMTNADWRRYMAEFTEEIRRAFPTHEIVHNALWFFGHDDPFVQRELASADHIELERGVNDAGLRGGDGQYGFERLLAHVDWLHERGKGIVFDASAKTPEAREYGLAAYFLVCSGADGLGNDPGSTPEDWWGGYDVVLGAPSARRHAWKDVLRRDFAHGMVLLNPPDSPRRTLDLERPYIDLSCQSRTVLTLGPAEGAVLRTRACDDAAGRS
jgi:hypothetical protein